jgi:hypothetical protein
MSTFVDQLFSGGTGAQTVRRPKKKLVKKKLVKKGAFGTIEEETYEDLLELEDVEKAKVRTPDGEQNKDEGKALLLGSDDDEELDESIL